MIAYKVFSRINNKFYSVFHENTIDYNSKNRYSVLYYKSRTNIRKDDQGPFTCFSNIGSAVDFKTTYDSYVRKLEIWKVNIKKSKHKKIWVNNINIYKPFLYGDRIVKLRFLPKNTVLADEVTILEKINY